jgi:hypothetical protein
MADILKRSKDRKVANSATPSGAVRIANTFGLPSGSEYSCIGQTSVCGSICYAGKLERIYKGVSDVLMHNYELLLKSSREEMTFLLAEIVADFVAETVKRGDPLEFRVHWDGDFFSIDYTNAWSDVIGAHPEVQFWVYTRNPQACALLAEHAHENLALYFSADQENWKFATSLRSAYGTKVRLAVLGQTFEEAKRMYSDEYSRPVAACPEQLGRIELITPKGGACITCGLCPRGKADIAFSISKK